MEVVENVTLTSGEVALIHEYGVGIDCELDTVTDTDGYVAPVLFTTNWPFCQ